jgi:hypothetical protein
MNSMNEDSVSRITRENFDKTLETGTETVRGIQEGVTAARENVRDLNVRLIDMAQANTDAAFDLAREVAEAKRRRIWSKVGQRTRPNSLTC